MLFNDPKTFQNYEKRTSLKHKVNPFRNLLHGYDRHSALNPTSESSRDTEVKQMFHSNAKQNYNLDNYSINFNALIRDSSTKIYTNYLVRIYVFPLFRDLEAYFRTSRNRSGNPVVDFSVEWCRIHSFRCCPRNEGDTTSFLNLASRRLYYESDENIIRCFSCRFVYPISEQGITGVELAHHQHSPQCLQLDEIDDDNLSIDSSMLINNQQNEISRPCEINNYPAATNESGHVSPNVDDENTRAPIGQQNNIFQTGATNGNGHTSNLNENVRNTSTTTERLPIPFQSLKLPAGCTWDPNDALKEHAR